MRLDLQTHPKIVRILSATKSDKFRVIGGLHAVWSVFDTHSSDGQLDGYTAETLGHVIGWAGFAEAMIAVGWLSENGGSSLSLPEFDEHNGASGKRRAEDQKRKRNDRKSPQIVRKLSAKDADENRTREEKRREELNTPISPVEKVSKRRAAIGFPAFLTACKLAGETPIQESHPVFAYAEQSGIPSEFLRLQWLEFKDRYADGEKRYKDWPSVFSKSVRGNWFKLWFISANDVYELTTSGKQAQQTHRKSP